MGCGASTAKEGAITGKPVASPDAGKGARPSDTNTDVSSVKPIAAPASTPPSGNPTAVKPSSVQSAVSLEWLEDFVKRLPNPDLTAEDASLQVVLPAIRGQKPGAASTTGSPAVYDSYAEFLLASGGSGAAAVSMGRPYNYALHARSRPLAGTVAMLHKFFAAEAQQAQHAQHSNPERDPSAVPEAFVWLDTFGAAEPGGSGGDGGGGGGGADATAELASARAVVEAAESVLLVLDDQCTALKQLWCLHGIWLANELGRPLRVLACDLDFEKVRHAIADLDLSEAAAEDATTPPRLRDAILADLLGPAALAPAGITSVTAAPASRALRDVLVASVLADAKADQRQQEGDDTAAPAARASGSGAADAIPASAKLSAAAIVRLDRAARLLEVLDRMAEAEVLFRRVLAATEAALGAEHPDTVTSAANLGSLLQDGGKLREAEPLLRRVLTAHERALGATHEETAASLEALGLLLESQGRLSEAEDAYRRALAAFEASLGPTDTDTLGAANNLSQLLLALDDPARLEEAEALCRRALAGYEAALGPEHVDTLGAVNNLAVVLKTAGKPADAEPLYRRALDGSERSCGADHPDTLSAASNLAVLLQARGDLAAAEPLFRRALAGREAALGPAHVDTLGSANNLAVLLQAQGQFSEAETLFRRALAGWEDARGPDHPDTLTAMYNLAVVLEELGRPQEALTMYEAEAAGRVRRGDAAKAEARQEHIRRLRGLLGLADEAA